MDASAAHTLQDDLLSSIVDAYRMRAHIYANPTLCGAWQLNLAGHRRAAFHLIGEGECWLHTPAAPPQPMRSGDLAVFARDSWHMLSGQPRIEGTETRMPPQTEGAFTTLVCGEVEFIAGGCNPVLDALPDIALVRREDGGACMEAIGRVLVDELRVNRGHTRIVIDKLADALFVMAIRHQMLRRSQDHAGVFAALADARLQRALAAMHRDPAQTWTLEALARIAAMSRAAFAKRFAEVMSVTPIEYLTRWRMTQAELLLAHPRASIPDAASRVGYFSEAAFRRAFKRIHGISPGSLRRWLRQSQTQASQSSPRGE